MRFNCAHCRKSVDRPAGHINRARAKGLRLFCGRRCSGLARRQHKTKAQRRAEKAAYDVEYRAKNLQRILARKKDYHKRTYDPVKAAVERKKRMPRHVEYCRQPKYKAYKREYDKRYRAREYGDFAEAFQLTIDLNREIKGRVTNHEVKYQNGGTNKTQRRKREARQEERSRNATSRRASDPAAHGW